MVDLSVFDLLQQHPVICAGPFLQWAGIGAAPYSATQLQRLRQALRDLLGQLTTFQRATHGGNYEGLACFLRRADINAGGLLGHQAPAAYAWLLISWRQPQPPPDVIRAWKLGLGQLINWVRHHSRTPDHFLHSAPAQQMQQAA